MKDLEYYTRIGKEDFELKGTELRQWVSEQMKLERKHEEEEAAKKRQHELELARTKDEEAEKVREEAEKVREEAERVRQHDSEMMQAQLELARLAGMKGEELEINSSKSGKHAPRAPAFKFSSFNDKVDDIDLFFDLFEKQCEAFGVPEGDRLSHLYGLFSGKYKDTLVTIETGSTYSQVRDKMLRTYNLTTNGYRERFFNLKPATGETMTAFVQRLQACFDKWVSLAKIGKDFKSLRDLIITHQISETCNPDFIKFILERDINDTVSILEKSDSFFQAHPDKQLAKPINAYSGNVAKYEDSQNTQYQRGTGRGPTAYRGNRGKYGFQGTRGRGSGNWRESNTQQGRGRGSYRSPGDYNCFHCNEKGHRKADCPKYFEEAFNKDPCFFCGKPGHRMKDVNKCDRAKGAVSGNAATVPGIADSMRTPLHADVCNKKTPWRDQHIYPGILIKGKEIKSVTVLRDTGSAVHAVHANLVSDRDYTGKYQQLVTFGGKEESFPLAYIEINTPFLSGKVLACVLQSYPEKFRSYDILIGNGGVLESSVAADPSPHLLQTWRDENLPVDSAPCNQVTTRSEAKNPRQEELKIHKDMSMTDCTATAGVIDDISRTCWDSTFESCNVHNDIPLHSEVSVVNDIPDPIEPGDSGSLTEIICPVLKQKESVLDISINTNLNSNQKTEIHGLVDSFSDIFSDLPAKTNAIKHTIKVSSEEPVKLKPYPLPFSSEQVVREEINNMLLNDVIEPSDSPYSSPIVLVKKKDGSIRFCIDFRKLNSITIGDACPIPDHDHIMLKMHRALFFTKLDMTKGYWQIEIAESDRHFTAFQAAGELYQFKRMAFGLKNAPMTFNRLMNRLIGQRTDTSFFFDDVIIFHNDWNSHVEALHEIFTIFRNNSLTVKPSKTEIAFPEIQFLGHTIGKGLIKPISENIGKILSIQVPKTKKQVRGIIGLVNFYAKFVPNIADLLSPLHELTGKGRPEKVMWGEECQASLSRIQELISSRPALIVPDIDDLFFVQTDASGSGLGCVLLQRRDGDLRPCRFHSRKLYPRETRYAVIEREALAIVWGLQKLARFLLGTEFVLQTDHAPLTCIAEGRTQNARLTRWALILQQFNFKIEYIKGVRNNVADYLSRYAPH